MQRIRRLCAILSLAALLTACGQDENQQAVEVTPVPLPEDPPVPVDQPVGTAIAATPAAQESPASSATPEASPALTPEAGLTPPAQTRSTPEPLFATPTPEPDVTIYMSAIEQDLTSLRTEGESQMPARAAQRLSVMAEQLARAPRENLSNAQKQALDTAYEDLNKLISQAQETDNEQEYQQILEQIRRRYQELKSSLNP